MFKIEEPIINNLEIINIISLNNISKIDGVELFNEDINLETGIDISNSKFNNIVFKKLDFKFNNIEDVIFENCDLSNKKFDYKLIERVEFRNCKMTGVTFISSSIKDILIDNSMCKYINFTEAKINNIK